MPTILVIDDEDSVRSAMKRVLERSGFTTRCAASVSEGLGEMRAQPADVVITDIVMPEADGVVAIGCLRRDFPAARIVAISGGGNFGLSALQGESLTTTAYLDAARTAGAHAVLTKPFGAAELLRAIEEALANGAQ